MERKTQLRNVAFGGNWSEALLEQDVAKSALSILRVAAENCMEEDPRGPELNQALGYVAVRVEKGPVLVSAFLKALAEPEQTIRREGMRRCFRQIEIWAGF